MRGTPEYAVLMHRIFPSMGEGSRVQTPLTAIRPHMVRIGRNVVIMPGCLMMSAGGITIDDGALIAANVQLISNNHDMEIMGEAMNQALKIYPDIQITSSRKIVDTGNFIIHAYDSLKPDALWDIVINHMPLLKKEIESLLNE